MPRPRTCPTFLTLAALLLAALLFTTPGMAAAAQSAGSPALLGNRFLTLNTVGRVRQIEVTRDTAHGPDESSVHTPAEARVFREAIADAWPGARITWPSAGARSTTSARRIVSCASSWSPITGSSATR